MTTRKEIRETKRRGQEKERERNPPNSKTNPNKRCNCHGLGCEVRPVKDFEADRVEECV